MMVAVARRIGPLFTAVVVLFTAQGVPPALTGTITSGGQPAAGVTIQAYISDSTQSAGSTTSSPDGTYKLPLPQGVYRVVYSGAAYDPATRSGVVVIPDAMNELNVVLLKAGTTRRPESLDDLKRGEVGVRIETIFGTIFLAVDTVHAPVTSGNFLKYVDAGFYSNGRFHRATRPDNYTPQPPNRPAMELIQGGIDPARAKEGFPAIPLERTSVTGLKHVVGTVSMARGTAADTATSDFFILLDDQPSLDFGGKRFDDAQGAAAFGRVYFGLGVVRSIQQRPVEGQNLTPPIVMLRVTRVN